MSSSGNSTSDEFESSSSNSASHEFELVNLPKRTAVGVPVGASSRSDDSSHEDNSSDEDDPSHVDDSSRKGESTSVDTDMPTATGSQDTDTTLVPDHPEQPMLCIDYFDPIPLDAFPAWMRDLTPGPASHLPVLVNPNNILVQKASVFLKAFFHFEPLHRQGDRALVPYAVHTACKLFPDDPGSMYSIFETLLRSRRRFLERTKGEFVSWPENSNDLCRKLAKLVDRYGKWEWLEIPRGPRATKGWDGKAVFKQLLSDWEGLKVCSKYPVDLGEEQNYNFTPLPDLGRVEIPSNRSAAFDEVIRAAGQLDYALFRFKMSAASDGVPVYEMGQIRGTLMSRRIMEIVGDAQ